MLNAIALDLETAPTQGHPQEYALQPWRYNEGAAIVTCCSVAKSDGRAKLITNPAQYRALLRALKGKTVTTWNGIFDVAWLIAYGLWDEVKEITWVDGMILWKWLDNSQLTDRMPAWSLADGAKRFFKDEPWCQSFIEMKKAEKNAGEDKQYWEQRAKLDAIVTAKICDVVWDKLDDRRRQSAMITMSSIAPLARSWWRGLKLDYDLLDTITPVMTREMAEIEYRLGCHNNQASPDQFGTNGWTPSKILRSPKQLSNLLYKTWKLECKFFSEKTGAQSASKAALTYLADECDQAIEILRWRKLDTQLSRYIQAPLKARAYLGSDIVHPSPKIFSTYTGRATYTSKTSKKYQTGIALHQIPRGPKFRRLFVPRKGYKHVEFDASGQESRIMAEKSGDRNMRAIFNQGLKFHANTGASTIGISYDEFMERYKAGDPLFAGAEGYYYLGKIINLSSNFRIGLKKMRINARVQYGINAGIHEVQNWQTGFHRSYPGVKKYWKQAITNAKLTGYAETLAGRRFKLLFWSKDDRWSTESSAIMHPIQGTGADMTDLAIQELAKHFPEFEFWFSLHDGIHMEVPVEVTDDRIREGREMLDNMDYGKHWGYMPTVKLKWDASVGARWSELKELD